MAEEIIVPTEEELNNEAILKFYEAFNQNFKQKEESPLGDFLFKELRKGKKSIYNKSIRETKIFDGAFIDILRNAYPSLVKIVRDPKKTIKYQNEVVAMEKAKKFNAESIRHLASHTQYIKQVDADGFVIPSKVLTTYSEDDLGMYENRFIKSLINRVIRFLEIRYELMQKNIESFQADQVKYSNTLKIDDTSFNLDINLRIAHDLEEETSTAKKILYDVESLLGLYRGLRSTPLYQAVAKMKEVLPPIMKTNIILHNADFKVAYNTWIYLDRSNTIGYNVDTKERKHTDSQTIALDMDKISLDLLTTLLYHRGGQGYDFKNARQFQVAKNKRTDEIRATEYKVTPKDIRMEHQEVSEYLLQETKDFYGKSLDEGLEQGLSYEMSVKKVYREMLEIVNRVYPSLFEREIEDLDVKTSNEQKLIEAKNQLKILKIVREQKQIDLRKMDRSYAKAERQVISLTSRVKEDAKKKTKKKVTSKVKKDTK